METNIMSPDHLIWVQIPWNIGHQRTIADERAGNKKLYLAAKGLSTLVLFVYEQGRLWKDCTFLQALLSHLVSTKISFLGQGVQTPAPYPLENHKAIGLHINTGLDPMENHKATTCADPESFVRGGPNLITFFFFFLADEGKENPNTTINGPSSARQRNAI